MSRSLFTIGWQDETDIQIYVTHSLSRLRGRWIRLPNPLLVSLWIHLVDPLLALPCRCHINSTCLYVQCLTSKYLKTKQPISISKQKQSTRGQPDRNSRIRSFVFLFVLGENNLFGCLHKKSFILNPTRSCFAIFSFGSRGKHETRFLTQSGRGFD